MDEEREQRPNVLTRTHGAWFWLIGATAAAAALYWTVPAGGSHPSSVTVFGITEPATRIASYPGLRVRPLARGQATAADIVR
ncbi:MAG TPA: hypothetical protein VN655_05755 [Pseudolabrys sp.]|jgi:hypothetical protein|nr:hypothetical protein [Pseudolabrys sp.]